MFNLFIEVTCFFRLIVFGTYNYENLTHIQSEKLYESHKDLRFVYKNQQHIT